MSASEPLVYVYVCVSPERQLKIPYSFAYESRTLHLMRLENMGKSHVTAPTAARKVSAKRANMSNQCMYPCLAF